MKFNYSRICNNLIKDLPERTKAIIEKRFGLKESGARILESIGKEYNITRERVRQIEGEGVERIRKKRDEASEEFFQYLSSRFRDSGGLKKEEKILSEWGEPSFQNYILFLLSLGRQFKKFKATNDFYSFWTIDPNSLSTAKQVIRSFLEELKKKGCSISVGDYHLPPKIASSSAFPLTKEAILSYIEISKHIMEGPDGLYGLPSWPEVNPRGIKDKAYLIFKRTKKPLHFTQAATLINNFSLSDSSKKNLIQSVHNELIRDSRFVLVGRGLYALREWGYMPGVTKEVILRILKKRKKPIPKEWIVKKVLEQREVKESTILLSLNDKRYFLRDSKGRYFLRPEALKKVEEA